MQVLVIHDAHDILQNRYAVCLQADLQLFIMENKIVYCGKCKDLRFKYFILLVLFGQLRSFYSSLNAKVLVHFADREKSMWWFYIKQSNGKQLSVLRFENKLLKDGGP